MLRTLTALTFLALASCATAAALPAEIAEALNHFHTEGTKGWGFLQTTTTSEHSMIERYTPEKNSYARWTLEKKNGQPPSQEEVRKYRDMHGNKPREESAPNVKNQIRHETCTLLRETPAEAVYRFKLKPGGEDDQSAPHMVADFTLHRPTGTVTEVSLHNFEAFSPMFGVSIQEIETRIAYTLPEQERPTLLKKISVKIRGRAMLVKSLDQDMTVDYSEHRAPATP